MAKHNLPDIDIDMQNRRAALDVLDGIPASIIKDGKLTPHLTGAYFTDIPVDALHGSASIDHKVAETRGYFKLDLLNMSVYEDVRDDEHLTELANREPNWERLWTDHKFVDKIVHINSYFGLLQEKKPSSLIEMAMLLAVIRPGKKHLKHKPWDEIAKTVWDRSDTDGYAFRHAHALSYAMLVQVHMNLIEEKESE